MLSGILSTTTTCYELADGELIEMEPTGSHETVSGKLATQIGMALIQENQPCFIPRTCLIRPFAEIATAHRPDTVVLDCNSPFKSIFTPDKSATVDWVLRPNYQTEDGNAPLIHAAFF